MARRKKQQVQDPVKKPYLIERFSPEQIDEIRRCSEDILYFTRNYVKVVDIEHGSVLFEPYDYQLDMISAFLNNRNTIIMAGRQLGKTTASVAYLLWTAIFKPEQTILVVSNVFAAASEIMERVRFAYEELPTWMKPGVTSYNKNSINFDNKSRIIARATTKNTGRGLSISLLYCDELAAVDKNKQQEFWSAIRPTLGQSGKCIITSTPSNDEDVFAQIWFGANDTFDEYGNEIANGVGRNGFKAIKYTWEAHPKRDADWEVAERIAMNDDRFEREHNCNFINMDTTLIDAFVLSRLKGVEPTFTISNVRWYSKPEADKTYMVSLDPSMGVGKDFAAIQVFQAPEMIQVAEWQHNKTAIPEQIRILKDILRYLYQSVKQLQTSEPEIYWTIENNAIGEAANIVIKEIGEEQFHGSYLHEPLKKGQSRKRKGYNTNSKTKLASCSRFKSIIERNKITLKSKPLISQLKVFVANESSFRGKGSEHDDLVSATLLIVRMLERVMRYDERISDNLKETGEFEGRTPLPIVTSHSSIYPNFD